MEQIPQKKLFRFGIFEADQSTGELRKQGRRVLLQGQPFDVLIMLLDRPGEVVSRTQIRERLWPEGTFVDFDHSLNTAVNKIRDVLGDSASSPRFIETLARRGYRFIAPVQTESSNAIPPQTVAEPKPFPPASEGHNTSTPEIAKAKFRFPQTFLTGAHEIPRAHRGLVRTLFVLLQVMYLCFY